jgi:hypothetical protein
MSNGDVGRLMEKAAAELELVLLVLIGLRLVNDEDFLIARLVLKSGIDLRGGEGLGGESDAGEEDDERGLHDCLFGKPKKEPGGFQERWYWAATGGPMGLGYRFFSGQRLN